MDNKTIAKYTGLALLYVAITFFAVPFLVSAPSTLLSIFGVLLLLVTHIAYIAWAWRKWFASSDEPHWKITHNLRAYGHRFSREQLEEIIKSCDHILHRFHPPKKDPK